MRIGKTTVDLPALTATLAVASIGGAIAWAISYDTRAGMLA